MRTPRVRMHLCKYEIIMFDPNIHSKSSFSSFHPYLSFNPNSYCFQIATKKPGWHNEKLRKNNEWFFLFLKKITFQWWSAISGLQKKTTVYGIRTQPNSGDESMRVRWTDCVFGEQSFGRIVYKWRKASWNGGQFGEERKKAKRGGRELNASQCKNVRMVFCASHCVFSCDVPDCA